MVQMIAIIILHYECSHLPWYYKIQPLGKNWISCFLKQQDKLWICYVQSINQKQAIANNNPAFITKFFANYSDTKIEYNVKDNDAWNMDKTGTLMGYAYNTKVIILWGRTTNFKTINGSKEWVSQIDCISMEGMTIPPFLVFKGHTHTERI